MNRRRRERNLFHERLEPRAAPGSMLVTSLGVMAPELLRNLFASQGLEEQQAERQVSLSARARARHQDSVDKPISSPLQLPTPERTPRQSSSYATRKDSSRELTSSAAAHGNDESTFGPDIWQPLYAGLDEPLPRFSLPEHGPSSFGSHGTPPSGDAPHAPELPLSSATFAGSPTRMQLSSADTASPHASPGGGSRSTTEVGSAAAEHAVPATSSAHAQSNSAGAGTSADTSGSDTSSEAGADVGADASSSQTDSQDALPDAINQPQLSTVQRVTGQGNSQLLVEGSVKTDAPVGSEFRLNFYATPVAVESGQSATPRPFDSVILVQRDTGAIQFTALLDDALDADQEVMVRAEGPLKTEATFSLPYAVSESAGLETSHANSHAQAFQAQAQQRNHGQGDAARDLVAVPSASGKYFAIDAHGKQIADIHVAKSRKLDAHQLESPLGEISFTLYDVEVGGAAVVDLYLPDDIHVDQAFKVDPATGKYFDFSFDGQTGVTFDGNVATIHLVDGGRGDMDGVANGVIVDPVFLDGGGQSIAELDVTNWSSSQSGGSGSASEWGSTFLEKGDLVLEEGNSFEVTSSTVLTIPQNAVTLAIGYVLETSGDSIREINDAFELAIIDASGNSLVPTIGHGRDSFFNFTEQYELAQLGATTTHLPWVALPPYATAAGTVQIDVSTLPANAILLARLVNNDSDTETKVHIIGNFAPIAHDDPADGLAGLYATEEDTPLSVTAINGVLNNDSDPEGATLSAVLHTGGEHGPFHGSLTLNSDGSFTYTPDADYHGDDTFTYHAHDGLKSSVEFATVTVTISSVNDAPVAADDLFDNVLSGTVVSGNVLLVNGPGGVADSDPDGDSLTATLESAPSYHTGGAFTLNADGSFTYSHDGFSSTDSFTYKIQDGNGATDSATVTLNFIEPEGQAPSISVSPVSPAEGSAVQLSASFTDPDEDDVSSVIIDWGDGTSSSSDNPGDQVTISQSAGSGTITAQHVYADNRPGDYAITIAAMDATDLIGTASISAPVSNVAPTLSAGLGFAAVEVKDGNRTVVKQAAMVTGSFSDPGFDFTATNTVESFSLVVSWGDGQSDTLTHGELDVVQGGIDQLTRGQFQLAHSYDQGGIYTVSVTVTDDDGGSDTVVLGGVAILIDEVPRINLKSNGVVLVKVHAGQGVDLTQLDMSTVRFGPAGAQPIRYQFTGQGNLHLHFRLQDTGIRPTDDLKLAYLTGLMLNGTVFMGSDIIRIANGSDKGRNGVTPPEIKPVGNSKFFVADGASDRIFRYSPSGQSLDSIELEYSSRSARGLVIVDSTPQDLSDAVLLSVGSTHQVGVQGADGSVIGTWRAFGLEDPQGITSDGVDTWIVDAGTGQVLRYAEMGGHRDFFGVALPTDSFALASANTSPTGITVDGDYLWVVDDVADSIFVYTRSGTLDGSWPLGSRNASPSGITGSLLDFIESEDVSKTLWVVDREDNAVYKYAAGKLWRSPSEAHDAGPNPFALHAQNSSPEGITDPQSNNQTPIAQTDRFYNVQSNQVIKLYVMNNDYDTDGDMLDITSVGTPSSGTVQISANGDYLTYTPGGSFSSDSFQYTVGDGYGGNATATVYLSSYPYDDGYGGTSLVDDTVYLYHVTDGDPVEIHPFDNDPGLYAPTIDSVSQPTYGSVSIHSSGRFVTYTPTAGHVDDSFTYTVDDGYGGVATATVVLDDDMVGGYGGAGGSTNYAPTATDDTITNITAGTTVNLYVLSNDTDPENDSLTIIGVGTPSEGSVQIAPGGGHLIYTADSTFSTDSFTYTISDGNGNADTATVYLEDDGGMSYGGPPVAYDDFVTGAVSGVPMTLDVLANDIDYDNDPLTIISVGTPSNGTVQIVSGPSLSFTPGSSFTSDSFTYTISDGNGYSDTATVTVSAASAGGLPPVAVDDVIWGVTPTMPINIFVLANDSDEDISSVSITATTGASAGTVTIRDGYLTYYPGSNFTDDWFTYTIQDVGGQSDTASVYLSYENPETLEEETPEELAYGGVGTVVQDDYYYDIQAGSNYLYVLDNDGSYSGDPVTIVSVSTPQAGVATIASGGAYLTYTPTSSGPDQFTYTVDDGSITQTATVFIKGWDYEWDVAGPSYFDWYAESTADNQVDPAGPAISLATAMASDPSVITGAAFETLPPITRSYAVSSTPVGAFAGTNHNSAYAILSTGEAALLNNPGQISSFDLGGATVRGDSEADVTVLRVDVNVPSGMDTISFDMQFFTEEYPYFVDTTYDDAFIVEIDSSTWTTSAGVLSAPNNIATLPGGQAFSVGQLGGRYLSTANAGNTAFDGYGEDNQGAATQLQRVQAPITPGAHSIYFSIYDGGHGLQDSAVTLSNLSFSNSSVTAPVTTPVISLDAGTVKNPFHAYTTVLITGQIPENINVASVNINGGAVNSIDANNSFFAEVTALPGFNQFEVVGTDTDGINQAFDLVSFLAVVPDDDGLWDLLIDASASVEGQYAATSLADSTDLLYADVKVLNNGVYSLEAPLYLGVTNISDPLVTLRGHDGVTPEGVAYYNVTPNLGESGVLRPGDSTETQTISFYNPSGNQFTYDLVVLGRPNKPPRFTSAPIVEVEASSGVVGEYQYSGAAYDENGHELRYTLVSGPAEMTVDAGTGEVTWDPSATDAGTHNVALLVEDLDAAGSPLGTSDIQQFVLTVTAEVHNRAPRFDSDPVLEAYVGIPYVYQVAGSDPDHDAISFGLLDGPAGIQLANTNWLPSPASTLLTWTPDASQIDQLYTVELSVSDGLLDATQSYQIRVLNQPSNRPPVIVTTPSEEHRIAGELDGPSENVSPTQINLELDYGQSVTETLSAILSASDFELPANPITDLTVYNETNQLSLLEALLSGGGVGIDVVNVSYTDRHVGATGASTGGIFQNTGNAFGLDTQGIVFSTGDVADYGSGVNSADGKQTQFDQLVEGGTATPVQQLLLDAITPLYEPSGDTKEFYDITQLDIQFRLLDGFDTIYFDVMFGSEEYQEYKYSRYNDAFGMYLDAILLENGDWIQNPEFYDNEVWDFSPANFAYTPDLYYETQLEAFYTSSFGDGKYKYPINSDNPYMIGVPAGDLASFNPIHITSLPSGPAVVGSDWSYTLSANAASELVRYRLDVRRTKWLSTRRTLPRLSGNLMLSPPPQCQS